MANDCYEALQKIANDRQMKEPERKIVNEPATKRYLVQVIKLLEIFYIATKQLEDDGPATIAKLVPAILNALLELEKPEVNTICLAILIYSVLASYFFLGTWKLAN